VVVDAARETIGNLRKKGSDKVGLGGLPLNYSRSGSALVDTDDETAKDCEAGSDSQPYAQGDDPLSQEESSGTQLVYTEGVGVESLASATSSPPSQSCELEGGGFPSPEGQGNTAETSIDLTSDPEPEEGSTPPTYADLPPSSPHLSPPTPPTPPSPPGNEPVPADEFQWNEHSEDDASPRSMGTASPLRSSQNQDCEEVEERNMPCILHLDSLRLHNSKTIAFNLREYLKRAWVYGKQRRREAVEKEMMETGQEEEESVQAIAELPHEFDEVGLPFFSPDVPRQENSYDCGVFVLEYTHHLLTLLPLSTTRRDFYECFSPWLNHAMFRPDAVDKRRVALKQLIDKLKNPIEQADRDEDRKKRLEAAERRRGPDKTREGRAREDEEMDELEPDSQLEDVSREEQDAPTASSARREAWPRRLDRRHRGGEKPIIKLNPSSKGSGGVDGHLRPRTSALAARGDTCESQPGVSHDTGWVSRN